MCSQSGGAGFLSLVQCAVWLSSPPGCSSVLRNCYDWLLKDWPPQRMVVLLLLMKCASLASLVVMTEESPLSVLQVMLYSPQTST